MKQTARLIAVFFVVLAAMTFAQDVQQGAMPEQGQRRGNQQFRGTAGAITAIDGDTLTVKQTMNDATLTVKLSDKTEYRKDREPAKLSDLKVGDFVIVRGERISDNEMAAQSVMSGAPGGGRFIFRQGPAGQEGGMNMQANAADMGKTFIVGEVKSIDGVKITVHRSDDQDQTIQADENTSFRKAGESITLPDIKVGDTVMGRGELKEGVFVPSQLNVVDPQRVQFMRRKPVETDKPQPTPPPQ